MTKFRKQRRRDLDRDEIQAIRSSIEAETPHALAKKYGVGVTTIWKQTRGLCRARVQYEGGYRKLSPAEVDAVVALAAEG